jgi:hypothetical protein
MRISLGAAGAHCDRRSSGNRQVDDRGNHRSTDQDAVRLRKRVRPILEVEVVCPDRSEHRRRVETRTTDVEGLLKPTWAAAMEREYEPWTRNHLVVDSAGMSPESAAQLITSKIASIRTETR